MRKLPQFLPTTTLTGLRLNSDLITNRRAVDWLLSPETPEFLSLRLMDSVCNFHSRNEMEEKKTVFGGRG